MDRDIEVEFGRRLRSAPALERWLRAYAEATASKDDDDEGAASILPRQGSRLGALFESLVTLSVRVYAQAAEAQLSKFYAPSA